MAEINATTNVVTNSKGHVGEEFTQSLDQLVKKKLKEAVKGIKKKMDEAPVQGGVQHSFVVTDPFVRQPMNRLNVLNLMSAGQQLSGLQKREGESEELTDAEGLSVRPRLREVGQDESGKSPTSTANRWDIDMSAVRHSGVHSLSHEDTDNRQRTLNKSGGEKTLTTESRPVERLQLAEQEGNPEDREVDEIKPSDLDKTTLLVTAGEHARVNVGDRGARSATLATVETSLPQQRPEFQSGKMMDTAPAEKAEVSKLTYRFSEWGGGHQVNVQLGAQHRTPHVLQPSDTLVHQRLADYDGQLQGDWVFSDDQEQSGNRRQQSDEEAE